MAPHPRAGWEARQYKSRSGKTYWEFSHERHGFTQTLAHTKRTEAEWREEKAKRVRRASGGGGGGGGGSSGAVAATATGEVASDADEASDEGGAAEAAGSVDPLQAMLQRKRQREDDEEAMKARVHAEMSMIMDTGVRVNPLLASRRAGS